MSDDARPNWQVRKCFELENENKQLRESVNAWREEYIAASSKGEKNATALAEAKKGLEFYERELGVNGEPPRKGYMMDGVADFELHTDGMYYGGKTARETLKNIDTILEGKG